MFVKLIVDKFAFKIQNEDILDDSQIIRMKYGMTVFINEFIKIMLLFLVFSFINQFNLFIYSFFILMTIRPLSGGLHLDTSVKCFLFSLSYFILSVLAFPNLIQLNKIIIIILLVISTILIYLYSPIPSKFRPISCKKRIQFFKILSTVSSIIWSIVIIFFIKNSTFINCGVWTIFLLAVQLFLAQGVKNYVIKN